jgi:ankyrin repeat protein
MVQLLIDPEADVNAVGGKFGTALQATTFRNNESIIKILLDAGADVTLGGGDFGSPL